MKNFALPSFILLSLIVLSACGTIDSLKDKSTYVSYARVQITETLAVEGRVLSMIDSTISIVVDGVPVQYHHSDIKGITIYKAPNPELVQQDIAQNMGITAGNIGFFVGLTIATLVLLVLTSPPIAP